jgi:hypothetical protein
MSNAAEINKKFLTEFESLKAKYGEAFADLKVSRFIEVEKIDLASHEYRPWVCRTDNEGVIHCQKEREQ